MMPRILHAFAALLLAVAACLPAPRARADFTFTAGTGLTGFSFTASTGGTSLCAALVTHCFASVPIDTAGAQLFATGNAGFVRAASGAFASGSIASGAMVDLGAIADAASTAGGTGTLSAKLRLMTTQLGGLMLDATGQGIITAIGNPIAAGGNVIGAVTQSGTWNIGTVTSLSQIAGVAPTLGDVNNAAAIAGALNVGPVARYNATLPTLTDTRYNMMQVDVNGRLHATLASAAPIAPATATATKSNLTGSQYNSTQATFTDGQQGAFQISSRGALFVTNGVDPITVQPGNTPNTTPWLANPTTQYPSGAVVYSNSATGTTGATTATLAASGGATTTYICGFSIRANATAAATGNATVTGTLSGTMNFTQWTAPNASGLGVSEMIFTPCYPASASNTAIAVVSAAPGTGGVVSVTAWGYKL